MVSGWAGACPCSHSLAFAQGRTKQHIEEATRTRVVIADSRVHVLGSVDGIQQVV